ncbi:MAG: HNH endonuclease [Steroidobacteraceae bacterium]|jgi:hypothetical protein
MDAGLRQFVRTRAAYQCEYCRLSQEFSELRFHIEHIVPRQHGGADHLDNLALEGPNLTGIDPQTGEVIRLFDPRRDAWFEHFRFDIVEIIGLTSKGRATASLLEMNHPERMRVRELVAKIQD